MIDKHFSKSETTKARIEALYAENQEMQQRLADMSRQQKAMEGPVNEKIKRNDELKVRLLELRRSQERVAESLERVKAEKARKQTYLEEMTEKILKSRQESEKLRPYVLQSPATLQASLTDLSDSLMRDKLQIDNMERRMRALQTSMDTFNVVANDVQSCVKVLEDIALELQKEEEEDARAIRNRDALTERGNTVREVAQTEKLLQRQLSRWHERTEALRKSSREKQELAQARMEELREIQKQLREERAEKQRDMERRRIRIEQTEKKVTYQTHRMLQNISNTCGVEFAQLTSAADGRPQGKYRERNPQRPRRVLEARVPYQALYHRSGKMPLRIDYRFETEWDSDFGSWSVG